MGSPGPRGSERPQQSTPGRVYEQHGGRTYGGQKYGRQGPFQGPSTQGGGYAGGYHQQAGYQPRVWNANWHDERHPKLKTMMAMYLERTNGRVHLSEILQAAGKKQTDLPTLPQYTHPNGRPFLCWSSVLGRCTFRECRFLQQGGHPAAKDITDDFADKVVDTLNKGVIALSGQTSAGGSPPKKQKGTSDEPPTL
jgi:hypothetical protein